MITALGDLRQNSFIQMDGKLCMMEILAVLLLAIDIGVHITTLIQRPYLDGIMFMVGVLMQQEG
jgi:hypothetical protein